MDQIVENVFTQLPVNSIVNIYPLCQEVALRTVLTSMLGNQCFPNQLIKEVLEWEKRFDIGLLNHFIMLRQSKPADNEDLSAKIVEILLKYMQDDSGLVTSMQEECTGSDFNSEVALFV